MNIRSLFFILPFFFNKAIILCTDEYMKSIYIILFYINQFLFTQSHLIVELNPIP